MAEEKKLNAISILLGFSAWVFVLCLNGAVPFATMPTLGQAVWLTGFSQSFANESLFTIYASNFGAPNPAAIAFGLAGAWPASVLIALGLHPADAYSAMVAFWLTVAFLSAQSIGRFFGVSHLFSILGATLWLSLPVVWAHSGYSMLSTGIALLSFYFLAVLHLFHTENFRSRLRVAFFYIPVCVIAVFMDGYSFMMFATGSSILAVWLLITVPEQRRSLLVFCLPVHGLGLFLGYALYVSYIGGSEFQAPTIDFFRGWGVDLAYLAVPTKGMLWLLDALGLSVSRSENQHFGDASVWMTTFSLPLIFGAIWACWKFTGRQRALVHGIAVVALFGFYMGLGPSLKVNSLKPDGVKSGQIMPAAYGLAPTGSEILSAYIPGFKNMRASYRWVALGSFGAWLLLIAAMGSNRERSIAAATILAILILSLPDLPREWGIDRNYRESFRALEVDLIADMEALVPEGVTVAFLPWRNDFLANYIAPRLKVVTFNIGGDKNYTEARRHWPRIMKEFQMGRIDEEFASRVVSLLESQQADVVILPYVDLLWAAHQWPYPIEYREAMVPVINELRKSGLVRVIEREYYAAVSPSSTN